VIPAGAEIRACPVCGIRSWEEHKGSRHRPGCPRFLDQSWPGELRFQEHFHGRFPDHARAPKAHVAVIEAGKCRVCGAVLLEGERRGFCEGFCRNRSPVDAGVKRVIGSLPVASLPVTKPVTTVTTEAAIVTCPVCQAVVPQSPRGGRLKQYCSDRHRIQHHRQKQP